MMRRFTALVGSLVIGLTLCILVMLLIDRRDRSESLADFGLHDCDGVPCWSDVMVGITSPEEIQAHAANYPALSSTDYGFHYFDTQHDTDIEFTFYGNNHLTSILIQRSYSPPIGEVSHLISQYGLPCRMVNSVDKRSIVLFYSYFRVTLRLKSVLNFHTPINEVQLTNEALCENSTSPNNNGGWQGFHLSYYQNRVGR